MEVGRNQQETQATIPTWLENRLSVQDLQKISETVREEEQRTTGEIIPMIVERSVSLGSAKLASYLLWISLATMLDFIFFSQHSWLYLIVIQLLSLFAAFLTTKVRFLLELFIPDQDEWRAVYQRAQLEFYRHNFHQTQDRTGILIFISYFERKIVLLADEGIHKKLKQPIWDEIVEKLMIELKSGHLSQGLTQAIKSSGDVLRVHFPAGNMNKNEIKDHLFIFGADD